MKVGPHGQISVDGDAEVTDAGHVWHDVVRSYSWQNTAIDVAGAMWNTRARLSYWCVAADRSTAHTGNVINTFRHTTLHGNFEVRWWA